MSPTRRGGAWVLLLAAAAASGCAIIPAPPPRTPAEAIRRAELLDDHLTQTRDAAIDRRHLTGGATMGVGVATVAGGLYLRTLEDADAPEGEDTLANSVLLVGALTGAVGLVVFFFPTEAEVKAGRYLDARQDPTRSPESTLLLGERALRSVALEDGLDRLEWGLPLLALGLLALGTPLYAPSDTPTATLASATSFGALLALGGGFITFTPTTAEARWSDYLRQAEALQQGEEAPALSWRVAPSITGEGAGIAVGGTW